MIFDATSTCLPELCIPAGFRLRCIEDAEVERYSALRVSSGFPAWDLEKLLSFRNKVLPDGMMLIEEEASGLFAASATAETTDIAARPELGVIGWVMTHPDFRGKHLGRIVSVAAMHRLYEEGYRTFFLLTDDFRIAALKTYLALGWKPWLYEQDMEERWRKIADGFERDFDSLKAYPAQAEFAGRTEKG
jgi:mycothiol synthase